MFASEIVLKKHKIIHPFGGWGKRIIFFPLTRRSVDSAVRQSPLQPELLRKLIAADMLAVDAMIRRRLESDVVLVRRIAEYIIAGGGKRLRPALVFLAARSEEHTSELQSLTNLVCRPLLVITKQA